MFLNPRTWIKEHMTYHQVDLIMPEKVKYIFLTDTLTICPLYLFMSVFGQKRPQKLLYKISMVKSTTWNPISFNAVNADVFRLMASKVFTLLYQNTGSSEVCHKDYTIIVPTPFHKMEQGK